MTQNEYYREIRGMQLCKCGTTIPKNQPECYGCWRSKTRRAAKMSFVGFFVRPSSWYRLEELYG